jgi:hypothetical protein
MSVLLFLVAAVALSAVGSAVILLRGREPKGSETSVKAFEREMRALSPEARRARSGSGPTDAGSKR